MTHRLSIPGEARNAVGLVPMTVALRYRCGCGDKELLSIQVVLDATTEESYFLETMRSLWRDMQFEVKQHIQVQD